MDQNNIGLFLKSSNNIANNSSSNNNNTLQPLYTHLTEKHRNLRQSRNSKRQNKKTLRKSKTRNNRKKGQSQKRQIQFNKGRGRTLESILDDLSRFTIILQEMKNWWESTENIKISEINFSNQLFNNNHLTLFIGILLNTIFTITKDKFQDTPLIINFNNSMITEDGINILIDHLEIITRRGAPTQNEKRILQNQLNYLHFSFKNCPLLKNQSRIKINFDRINENFIDDEIITSEFSVDSVNNLLSGMKYLSTLPHSSSTNNNLAQMMSGVSAMETNA